MKPIPPPDSDEATRLTPMGRLGAEAVAFLWRVLRGKRAAPRAAKPAVKEAIPARSDAEHPPGARVVAGRAATQAATTHAVATKVRVRKTTHSTFAQHSFSGPLGGRDYKLYVPAGYDGKPWPLVVMLHGCTQSVDDFAGGTNMNALADQYRCLVAYPIQPTSANSSKCWNWFNLRDQLRDSGEPSLIVGIVHQIADDYAVDSRRVYVAGLSAGGAAAAVLGTRYPDVFAAIGVHSGLACGAAHGALSAIVAMQGRAPAGILAALEGQPREPLSEMPTIVFHGDRDTTVNLSNSDRIVESTQASAHDPTIETSQVPGGHEYTRDVYRDDRGRIMLERWTIHGAGHAWSGGKGGFSYTDPAGPNASQAMLRFFLTHHR